MLTELYQNCLSYRDFYAPITINVSVVRFMESFNVGNPTKTVGAKPSVRLKEVSVKRELTVFIQVIVHFLACFGKT